MTPYFERDGIVIYHGDCMDVLPNIPDTSVELVCADPPYNFGVAYKSYDDNRPEDEYRAWCATWFGECRRIGGRVVIFPGHGNLPTWWDVERPHGVGCWYKPGNPGRGGIFQFCEWEPILAWGKRVPASDVFRATVTEQQGVGDHPCPKPLKLLMQVIERTKASTVLDPFMGSGTTIVAAHQLGRRAIGIELDESYCEIAARRLEQDVLPFDVPEPTPQEVQAALFN